MKETIFWKKIKKHVKGYIIDHKYNSCPKNILKSDLEYSRDHYNKIISELVDEINEYKNSMNHQKKINPSIQFSDYKIASYNGDRMGKVLIKSGQIYRGIYSESCDDFYELWNTGILQVLGERGYIPRTEISEYYTKEYGLILHHDTVEMSASVIWTFSMLKDACIHAVLINTILKSFGFKLHDGHLNNLTFNKGKPVFTDIGSIVKDRGQLNYFEKELVFSGCYKMMFLQMGNSALSRVQVFDENNNSIWIFPRQYNDYQREYRFMLKQYKHNWRLNRLSLSRQIADKIFDGYEVKPEYIENLFSNSSFSPILKPIPNLNRDSQCIVDELRNMEFASVLLFGGTGGQPIKSLLELPQVTKATCVEFEYAYAEEAYNYLKNNDLNANLYLYHHLYAADEDTIKLLQSDVVVANDIVNQVITVQKYKLDSLCKAVHKLTKKYALVTVYPYKINNSKYNDDVNIMDSMIEAFQYFFALKNVIEIGDKNEKESFAVLLVGEKI